MKNKYELRKINICTLKIDKRGIIPNLEDYPFQRLCVIDVNNCTAIDVNHKLKYDYLETINRLYFINKASSKIKENKRVAIFPTLSICPTTEDINLAKNIIEKLENGYEFKDGNEALSNEEYLSLIKKEQSKEVSNKKQLRKK